MKKVLSITLGLVLSISGGFLVRSNIKVSNSLNDLSIILDGAQTCFLRVNQSYSAKMIGLESSYLKKDFLDNTENCYSDLSEMIKKVIGVTTEKENIDELSDEVYWFHRQENFENPFTMSEEQEQQSQSESYKQIITEKFKSIEALNLKLVELLSTTRIKLSSKQSRGYIFQLTFGGLFLLLLASLFNPFVRRKFFGVNHKEQAKVENEMLEDSVYQSHEEKTCEAEENPISNTSYLSISKEKDSNEIERYNLASSIKEVLRELSPAFFNLNSTINISGLEKVSFSKEFIFSSEELRDFLKLIIRFSKGGKFPIQIEFKKKREGDNYSLLVSAVNTNFCLYLNETVKDSLSELKEIKTHDGIILGFHLDKNILLKSEDAESKGGLRSLYVGQKKDLLKRMEKRS